MAGSSLATGLLVGETLAVACGSRGVAGRVFLVVACWAALGRRDLLPGGVEMGGKACRGRALVLCFLDENISRGRLVMQRKGGGVYEGEIRGGHLVVGRLASQREAGGDLSI